MLFIGEIAEINLNFYCVQDFSDTRDFNISEYRTSGYSIEKPCMILVRNNSWNDFGYCTFFHAYFMKDEDAEIIDLGQIKIIQSSADNKTTTLPEHFRKLPKDEYFSRSSRDFYKRLKMVMNFKSAILSALNEVNFHGVTEDMIIEKENESLLWAYQTSLFRADLNELEVPSEYAKFSLEVIKI